MSDEIFTKQQTRRLMSDLNRASERQAHWETMYESLKRQIDEKLRPFGLIVGFTSDDELKIYHQPSVNLCEGTCSPYLAKCGAGFCSKKDAAAHDRLRHP